MASFQARICSEALQLVEHGHLQIALISESVYRLGQRTTHFTIHEDGVDLAWILDAIVDTLLIVLDDNRLVVGEVYLARMCWFESLSSVYGTRLNCRGDNVGSACGD